MQIRHEKYKTNFLFNRIEPILQHEGFLYTFIFAYFLLNVLFFFRGASPEWKLGADETTFIRITRALARGTGSILNINSALVILGALKIILTFLRRTALNIIVPFDKAMPHFHRLVGTTIGAAGVFHTIAHTIRYGMRGMGTLDGIHGSLALVITGIILFICIAGICITTIGPLRRMISYEIWGICHITSMVLFFSTLLLHGSHHGKYSSYKFVVAPLLLYAIDIFLRRLRSRFEVVLTVGDTAKTVGPDIIKLQMMKDKHFPYLAGQYCYLKIPQISKIEWHPFSIASSPHENHVTFYIKVNGNWTSKLYKLCTRDSIVKKNAEPLYLTVFVSGAYGAPAEHVGQYEHIILISGGVGATPFTSVTKYVHNYIMNHTVVAQDYARSPHATFNINYTIQAYKARKNRKKRQKALKEEFERREANNKRVPPPPKISLDKTGNRKSSPLASSKSSTLDSLGDPTEPIPSRKSFTLTDSSDTSNVGAKTEDYLMLEHEISSMGMESIGRGIGSFRSVEQGLNALVVEEPMVWKKCGTIVAMHSITINFLLFWIMFLRFGLAGIAKITGAFNLQQIGFNVYSNLALNVIDLILSIMLLIPMGLTLFAEMCSCGPKRFFKNGMNVCGVLVLLPLSFLCALFHVFGFSRIGSDSQHASKLTVLCIWPIICILLFLRIILNVGYRVALAPFRKAQTKSLDFIWVNRTSEQDKWILAELLPIASGPLRIHRFLTGQDRDAEDGEWKKDYIHEPLETTYSRPDWNEVFLNVIENSRSGSVIGVFFCGSPRIQRAVQEAAMNASQQSIRNSYERGYDSAARRRQADGAERSFDNLTAYFDNRAAFGCNICISVRVENFS